MASSANIAGIFADAAAAMPERTALTLGDAHGGVRELTFAELDAWSDAYALGLRTHGLQPGERLLLLMKPGADFIALALGLLKAGVVPVLIDAGMDRKSLLTCIASARPDAMVGAPATFVLQLMDRAAFATVRKRWIAGVAWAPASVERMRRTRAQPGRPADVTADTPAAIVFTTGSTGVPKGVVFTHGNYGAEIAALRRAYGIEPGERIIAASHGFAILCLCMGNPCVVPHFHPARPGAVDPAPVLALTRRCRPQLALGSAAFWERIAAAADGDDLASLRLLLLFGAEVHESILRSLASALPPGAEIQTPYGATEAQPLTTISGAELLSPDMLARRGELGVCVGRPIDGVELELIEITDDPRDADTRRRITARGAIGEVTVRGPMVSSAYVGQPEQTRLQKISAPGGAWHRMGDCGTLDDEGRLWLVGRKAHRITTADGTVFPLPAEACMNRHPLVRRSALVGVGQAGAQRAILVVEVMTPPTTSTESRALAAALLTFAASHAQTRMIHDVLLHPLLPVDYRHNTKIQRQELARWAAARIRAAI